MQIPFGQARGEAHRLSEQGGPGNALSGSLLVSGKISNRRQAAGKGNSNISNLQFSLISIPENRPASTSDKYYGVDFKMQPRLAEAGGVDFPSAISPKLYRCCHILFTDVCYIQLGIQMRLDAWIMGRY